MLSSDGFLNPALSCRLVDWSLTRLDKTSFILPQIKKAETQRKVIKIAYGAIIETQSLFPYMTNLEGGLKKEKAVLEFEDRNSPTISIPFLFFIISSTF